MENNNESNTNIESIDYSFEKLLYDIKNVRTPQEIAAIKKVVDIYYEEEMEDLTTISEVYNESNTNIEFIDYSTEKLLYYIKKMLAPQEIEVMKKVVDIYYEEEIEDLTAMLEVYYDDVDKVLVYINSFDINIDQCKEKIKKEGLTPESYTIEEDILPENKFINQQKITQHVDTDSAVFQQLQKNLEKERAEVSRWKKIAADKNFEINGLNGALTTALSEIKILKRDLIMTEEAVRDLKREKNKLTKEKNELITYIKSIQTHSLKNISFNENNHTPWKSSRDNQENPIQVRSRKTNNKPPHTDFSELINDDLNNHDFTKLKFISEESPVPVKLATLICENLGIQLLKEKSLNLDELKERLTLWTKMTCSSQLYINKKNTALGTMYINMEQIFLYFLQYFDTIEPFFFAHQKMNNSENIDINFVSTLFTHLSKTLYFFKSESIITHQKFLEITESAWKKERRKKRFSASTPYQNPFNNFTQKNP